MKRMLFGLAWVAMASCAPRGGAESPSGQVTIVDDPLDGRRWLEREAMTVTSLGGGPLQLVATGFGNEGDKIGAFVTIPEDACLLAYGRGSFGVEDLDLYAFADDGATLAIDEAPDPHPAVVICPPHPGRAHLSARISQGRGIAALGAHAVSKEAIAEVGKALGARGRPGEAVGRAESWPGLDEKLAARRRKLGGEWEELRRVAVPADARAPTLVSAEIREGSCLDVLVLPDDEVQALDVAVLDESGRIVARGVPWGRQRTSLVCASVESVVSVELRPHGGHGLAAIVLSRAEAQSELGVPFDSLGATHDLARARALRSNDLEGLGYAKAAEVARGTATVGRKESFPIDLPEGCARVDVIAGAPIAGLVVDLWDSSGRLLAREDGSAAPSLFACGPGGKGRIDVEATSRRGPFAIELRRERSSPEALVAHPLAASRLLAHLESRATTAPISAQAAGEARPIALEAGRAKRVDVPVREGRCVDVVAALDKGASGLELRLVDAQNVEIARGRGHSLAMARACASRPLSSLYAEVRVDAGRGSALLAVRDVAIPPGH